MPTGNWIADVAVCTVIALCAAFWILQFAYERQVRRANERFAHRANLRKAAAAGESSLEYQTMRCTFCGGFHVEDDEDCPVWHKQISGAPEGK
jgi:hypothetical protein